MNSVLPVLREREITTNLWDDLMLARDPNHGRSEFIREEAGTFTAYVPPEAQPSRMNSVLPVLREREITTNLRDDPMLPCDPKSRWERIHSRRGRYITACVPPEAPPSRMNSALTVVREREITTNLRDDLMLACEPNSSGSEFIREEAGTSTACVSPEPPPSRMNSVPPVLRELEITSKLWEPGLPAIQALQYIR
ncbi:hypothetical protein NLO95_28475 [Pseudomonas syringae]|nr:hypothetical protein [Pseudomonas syringae]